MSHHIMTAEQRLNELRKTACDLNCAAVSRIVLNDSRFPVWSGSHYKKAHHYGDGGLLTHTYEVVSLCLHTASVYSHIHNIDTRQLFLSALYHDYGKVWDYDKNENGVWVSNIARRKIHHISRSNSEWVKNASYLNETPESIDSVSHNILSHHGQRAYGSPIMPYTREAWILHLCDSLSARIDDCDRIDIANIC